MIQSSWFPKYAQRGRAPIRANDPMNHVVAALGPVAGLLVVLLTVQYLGGCAGNLGGKTLLKGSGGFNDMQAKHLIETLSVVAEISPDDPLYQAYYQHYRLPRDVTHRLSSLRVDGYRIAVQRFQPSRTPVGTVFFVHGYLVHSALHRKLIAFLLSANMAVITFDLPGHGLSSGQRGAINEFSDYAKVLDAVVSRFRDAPRPHLVVAHSTGGACVIQWLRDSNYTVDALVLAAPLVRSKGWWFTQLGTIMLGQSNPVFPRLYRKSTSDLFHLHWVRTRDPLLVREAPFKWVRALVRWESSLADYPVLALPVLVLQGDEDQIVNGRHNLSFVRRHFAGVRITVLEGARHELFVETDSVLERVFIAIEDFAGIHASEPFRSGTMDEKSQRPSVPTVAGGGMASRLHHRPRASP